MKTFKELEEGFAKSTSHAVTDKKKKVIAKGNSKDMRKLVKQGKGVQVWLSPNSKIGDTLK